MDHSARLSADLDDVAGKVRPQVRDALAPSSGKPSRKARHRAGPQSRRPAWLQVVAALLWLPQAAAISYAIGGIAENGSLQDAFLPVAVVVVVGCLKVLLDAFAARLAFLDARAILSRKRADALQSLAARSPLDRSAPASGLAASVVAEQADMIVPYLSRFQPARLKSTVVPLVIVAAVLPFSWMAALVLFISGPLIPIFMALIGWRAQAASEKQLVRTGSLNAFLLDRLRGLATIRALGAVDRTAIRLAEEADSLRRRTMAVLRIAFLSSAVLELFAALGVALMAVYVGFHLLGHLDIGAWGGQLSLAEGLFILLLAPAFFEPLRELAAVWHDRAAGEAALKALDELAVKGSVLLGGGDAAATLAATRCPAPSVRVEAVSFTHAGRTEPTLQAISLAVAAGERVALLGPSGCGKSTLIALIAGLAAADSGRISIGGTELTAKTADRLRRGIAFVGQKPHIFAGSVAANIGLGRPGVDGVCRDKAMRTVSFEEIARHHGPSPLGENGVGLSGGEVLRLALARAAAGEDAGLVLADEPTAHLDRQTAAGIVDGLMALSQGRTLIVATHDPLLAARMDRIVDLSSLQKEAV
ncbi:thiol reductant ABC exporter subunit CydD [Metarhizobium album]|uniref:Thiol reductant ABC exporter subunit CydD n=1 Tax=Metarhizobium album TaxID=2182425 RepID=A0A2U2DRN3_9HYPH|nr:thiol reductant ABC exporter subunit CydD [Rhizobium album]